MKECLIAKATEVFLRAAKLRDTAPHTYNLWYELHWHRIEKLEARVQDYLAQMNDEDLAEYVKRTEAGLEAMECQAQRSLP